MGRLWKKKKSLTREIEPDEILLDAQNTPGFDRDQFEGRLERPLSSRSFYISALVLGFFGMLLLLRAGDLQVLRGGAYEALAQENQLTQQVIFADRGMILDRTGVPLAYDERTSTSTAFASRVYAPYLGIAHVVGYVKPPAKDSTGTYFRTTFVGLAGAEEAFDTQLGGTNGLKLTETNARGDVVAESVVDPPVNGQSLTLSIDAKVTQGLYEAIAAMQQKLHFTGGAAVIMNVHTGQLLVMTSYPDFSSAVMEGGDPAAVAALLANPERPFLNRAIDGTYAPGSIVKPIVGIGALTSGVIGESTQILSTGSISIPNPFDPSHPSVFLDWRPNGWVDVRHAIAVSSDVYFYEVGGGYQSQPGLGISGLDKYFSMFGLGSKTGLVGFNEEAGNVPTPAWKAANFPNDPTWRLGDTYHTAIGQYGMLVTPLQMARVDAAIANGGELLTPTLLASSTPQFSTLPLPQNPMEVVREGMRLGVTSGIVQPLNFPFVEVAAKTGTAQVGTQNQNENSWVTGFFPYSDPEYSFAIVLEHEPAGAGGATTIMASFLAWLEQNAPQYLQNGAATSTPA